MSTVLVVEDSVAQREMIEDLLKGSGLTVTAVGGGAEALKGHPRASSRFSSARYCDARYEWL